MTEDVRHLVASVAELWNTGNAEIAHRVYADDCPRVESNLPPDTQGGAAVARYVAELRSAYPDLRLEVNETVSEGDRLVVRWTATGTHGGMFRGLAPTGKRINIEGVTLARVKDGKLTEDRVYFDRMTMFEQLGVVPEGLQGRQTMGAG